MDHSARHAFTLVLGAAILSVGGGGVMAAPAHRPLPATPSPAPIFLSGLPRLARARIPVYLPSWLPRFPVRLYASMGLTDHGTGYFAYLNDVPRNAGEASLAFTLDADTTPPNTAGPKVALFKGVTGYIDRHTGGNMGPTIAWRLGKYTYQIGRLYPEWKLIRAARSMVLVRTTPRW